MNMITLNMLGDKKEPTEIILNTIDSSFIKTTSFNNQYKSRAWAMQLY